ncbi:MAG: hypothetical protein AAF589_07615 [Planctomycetota bacterium]
MIGLLLLCVDVASGAFLERRLQVGTGLVDCSKQRIFFDSGAGATSFSQSGR